MSNENQNGFIDQLGRGLGGLFKFIVRLVFVLILAAALGAGLYYGIAYGIPALDRAYLQPVRDNTSAIDDLEKQVNSFSDQNNDQIAALQDRITSLEVQNDTNLNTIDALQTQLDALSGIAAEQAILAEQAAALESDLASLAETVTSSEEETESALGDIQEIITQNQEAIAAISAELAANDFPIDQAYADLQLVKAMSLLTRAQVFIFQANYGLATADVESARSLLSTVDGDPALAGLDLTPVLNRLSLALGSLPLSPDLASSDISVAWDLLVEGVTIGEIEPDELEPVETEETPF